MIHFEGRIFVYRGVVATMYILKLLFYRFCHGFCIMDTYMYRSWTFVKDFSIYVCLLGQQLYGEGF